MVRGVLRQSSADFDSALEALRSDISSDAVHQTRVTIRRAESALGLGHKVFAVGSTDTLHHELKWMMTAIGDLRDLDVLVARLEELGANDELIAEFQRERSESAARLLVLLVSDRCQRVAERLRSAARRPSTVPQADDDARRRLRPIVRQRWRKLERAVDRLDQTPTPQQLHHVRILAKRCRYTCEICEIPFGAPARTMARRLRKVQDELGALHDTDVLIGRLRDIGKREPSLAFSAGEAAGIARAADESDARRWRQAWRQLDRREVLAWL